VETEVAAIVLAAGGSRRLGRPKALLDFGGLTALEVALRTLREAGVTSGVVVTGEETDVIRRAVDATPFVWVVNPMPAAGRTGSVIVGLAALRAVDVLLWPVDRPLASAETVRALLEARAEEEDAGSGAAGVPPDAPGTRSDAIVPESDGRRGHPFLLRATLRAAVLAAAPDASLREVLKAAGTRRRVVPVEDPGIHFNLDTPEAWEEALAWWRARRR
jgi:molybdenum cofactor cytidylyltransferase